jgi:hypothetical protein
LQQAAHKVRVWNDDNLEGLQRLAAAVEGEDCRLLGQVQDSGRGRHERGRNPAAIGVSSLPDDLSWTVPHVLRADELQGMVDDFAQSAAKSSNATWKPAICSTRASMGFWVGSIAPSRTIVRTRFGAFLGKEQRVLPLLRAPNTSVRPRHPAPRTRDRWETAPRPPDRWKTARYPPARLRQRPQHPFLHCRMLAPPSARPPVRPPVRPPARSLARPTARPHFIVVFCLAISALLRLRPRAARPPAGAPF